MVKESFAKPSAQTTSDVRCKAFRMASEVSPTAVIQPKPGIGDVIWHLPFVRAIAAVSPGGRVTFLAPATSGARELFAAEPSVAQVIYFDHAGSELRRALNLIRLARLLRRNRFRAIWILDRTTRPALAAFLAGIPERIGVGLTAQRLYLTNAGIAQSHFHDHPIDWLHALMTAMNVPVPAGELNLQVRGEALQAIDAMFASCARPWIVLGIGAAHPSRDWPDAHWREFIAALRQRAAGTVFLIGGPAHAARAQGFVDESAAAGGMAINACALKLHEALALLRRADLFAGPDSGPMNMAAAVGTPAFAMFGVNPVLAYSKFIHPIVPASGQAPDGMRHISPAQVLAEIAPYLSQQEARG